MSDERSVVGLPCAGKHTRLTCWFVHPAETGFFNRAPNGKFATVRHRRSEPDWRLHAGRVRYPTVFSWADLLQEIPIYSARLPFFSGREFFLQVERQLPIPIHVGAPDHQVDSALNCIAAVFRIVAIAIG